MTKMLNKALTTVALAGAVALVSPSVAQADEFFDFVVDPTGYDGTTTFTADIMKGAYEEVLFVTSVDGAGGGTFSTYAYWDLPNFIYESATLTGPETGGHGFTYRVYGLFVSDGSFAPNSFGGTTFTGGTGSIYLYVDDDVDTDFVGSLPAALPAGTPPADIADISLGDDSDDVLLATASLAAGSGFTTSDPLASGDFGLLFNPFTLTLEGESFFIDPVPFYMTAILKGQFNYFNPTAVGRFETEGSADAFFQPGVIPEPTTLALLGSGLLGAAWLRRRRRVA